MLCELRYVNWMPAEMPPDDKGIPFSLHLCTPEAAVEAVEIEVLVAVGNHVVEVVYQVLPVVATRAMALFA